MNFGNAIWSEDLTRWPEDNDRPRDTWSPSGFYEQLDCSTGLNEQEVLTRVLQRFWDYEYSEWMHHSHREAWSAIAALADKELEEEEPA